MTREIVRACKRRMRVAARAEGDMQARQQARESALALLNRSIAFGHGRLAVLRFDAAVRLGAEVPSSCLDHCRAGAEASHDPTLQRIFTAAVEQHSAARGC